MKEDVDYKLIPAQVDNEQAWEIRILTGEFVETVLRFGNISIDGPNEALNFNFMVTHSPGDGIDEENKELQQVAGEILGDLIDNSINDGTVLLEDK